MSPSEMASGATTKNHPRKLLVCKWSTSEPCSPRRGLLRSHALRRTEVKADDTLAHQRYAEQMRLIVELLTARFRPDAVNLLMAHTHLDGAV